MCPALAGGLSTTRHNYRKPKHSNENPAQQKKKKKKINNQSTTLIA